MGRTVFTILAAGVLNVALSGCVAVVWPEHGRGGFAEADALATLDRASRDDGRKVLADRLACGRSRLDLMRKHDVDGWLPAATREAELRWNRAARELDGGLVLDAAEDLDLLDAQILELVDALAVIASVKTVSLKKGCML